MGEYTSYYLYQKYQKQGSQDWVPVYPAVYSVNAEGSMPLSAKTENDPECGYVPPTPSFDGKFKATYLNSDEYEIPCDQSDILYRSETQPSDRQYSAMTTGIVGDCVTDIDNQAFEGCSSLSSITISNSVTSIGYRAFCDCSSLQSLTIPSGVTDINALLCAYCTSLSSVTIPSGVTTIAYQAFAECNSLTSITIPNAVTSIGNNAFWGCGFSSLYIPSSVTSIGAGNGSIIVDTDSVYEITVDSNNTIYDSRNNCNAIIETATNSLIAGCGGTIIPNTVTSIYNGAFSSIYNLTSITIPNRVTTIGNRAFSYCSGLTSVTIGSGVTSIGDNAFNNCNSLTSITVNATTPPTLGTYPFGNTNNCPIYVPSSSVTAYKNASGWSTYSSRIYAI